MTEFKNKLLKEAIADAEAVRHTAIENAKISLEETFAPQFQSMLSRRLRAEAQDDDKEDVEADKEKETTDENTEADTTTTVAVPRVDRVGATTAIKDESVEKPHEDGEPVGSSQMPADSSVVGTGDNKEPSADAFDASDIGNGPEAGDGDNSNGWYDDWNESDFDLDEVIKELEEDVADLQTTMQEGDSEESDDKEGDAAAPNGLPAEKPEAPTAVPAATPAPEAGAGDEEELDLEAIIRELEAEDDAVPGAEGETEAPTVDSHKVAAELGRIKSELAEYRKAVQLLRGKLQEVNLLNAKLLYTNKMFRKEGLSHGQKMAIVEGFDRATTVREVKMVYTVLVETLTSTAKTLRATTKPAKKVVAEGMASKPTATTARVTAAPTEIITEQSAVAKRLQTLAGILAQ